MAPQIIPGDRDIDDATPLRLSYEKMSTKGKTSAENLRVG